MSVMAMLRQLQRDPVRQTFLNRPAVVEPYDSRLVGAESWQSRVQRTCGYVVHRIRLLGFWWLASNDFENIAVVFSIRRQSQYLLIMRQLRKGACVTDRWVGFSELVFGCVDRPQS